jgi:hypothetical protein
MHENFIYVVTYISYLYHMIPILPKDPSQQLSIFHPYKQKTVAIGYYLSGPITFSFSNRFL